MKVFNPFEPIIRESVGNSLKNKEDDVRKIRNGLEVLTVIDDVDEERDPDNRPLGLMTRRLDSGIKKFQRDNDLREDGRIYPEGETETALKESLKGREKDENGLVKKVNAGTLPAFIFSLALLLGMTPMSAWDWYQKQSPSRKKELRNRVNANDKSDIDNEVDKDDCYDNYSKETVECNNITRRKGKRSGAICHQSAAARLAACNSGKPRKQWPNLQD